MVQIPIHNANRHRADNINLKGRIPIFPFEPIAL